MSENMKNRQVEKHDIKMLVQADKQDRQARATEAIQKVLEKERCVMDVAMVLHNGQVITQLTIVAQD